MPLAPAAQAPSRSAFGSDFVNKYPNASCRTPRPARRSTRNFTNTTEQSTSQLCPLPLQRALQWLLGALLVGVEKAPGMPALPAICGSWCTVRFGDRPCCPHRLSRHFLLASYELSVRGVLPKCTKPRAGSTVAAAHALLLSSSGSPVVLETPKCDALCGTCERAVRAHLPPHGPGAQSAAGLCRNARAFQVGVHLQQRLQLCLVQLNEYSKTTKLH